jgi:P2-related tail formation protein
MSQQDSKGIIENIIETVDIDDAIYENAERRYKDIGDWLGRQESACANYGPHVFPQGSFRLGTVNRPLNGNEEYDLDLSCKLQEGISKGTHSQEMLKKLVGVEVETYRQYRNIDEQKEEKHRCWRLNYKDQMKFHMDIVPCIPEEEHKRQSIKAAMIKQGSIDALAGTVSGLTVAITDNRLPQYRSISGEWHISNPEGYARWFESRMELANQFLQKRALALKAAVIDELPIYRWKTPLQRCVQILKRHRDVMFTDNLDAKPISIIITTLAAKAYSGETSVDEAIMNVINNIGALVSNQKPRIPNPVNPSEDFADRWLTREGLNMRLEQNFWLWLDQAKTDFGLIKSSDNIKFLTEQTAKKFSTSLNLSNIKGRVEVATPTILIKPRQTSIADPPKPWRR